MHSLAKLTFIMVLIVLLIAHQTDGFGLRPPRPRTARMRRALGLPLTELRRAFEDDNPDSVNNFMAGFIGGAFSGHVDVWHGINFKLYLLVGPEATLYPVAPSLLPN